MTKGPSLGSSENLIHTQSKIMTFYTRCGGKMSAAFAIPFFIKWTLFVTNKRIHLATTALSFLTIRKDIWFPDCNPVPECHIVKSVSYSLGLNINAMAYNPLGSKHRVKLVMKFGFKGAAQVAKLVKEQMEIANQRLEPIVKTPVDEVKAQGTQAHP